VIDMLGLARPEQGLEQRILEDAAIERVLKAMERFLAACEFVEGRDAVIVRGRRCMRAPVATRGAMLRPAALLAFGKVGRPAHLRPLLGLSGSLP
jgi:hypothetical protein